MPLKRSVLIAGASTGIGAVYADRFAQRRHDLVPVALPLRELIFEAACKVMIPDISQVHVLRRRLTIAGGAPRSSDAEN